MDIIYTAVRLYQNHKSRKSKVRGCPNQTDQTGLLSFYGYFEIFVSMPLSFSPGLGGVWHGSFCFFEATWANDLSPPQRRCQLEADLRFRRDVLPLTCPEKDVMRTGSRWWNMGLKHHLSHWVYEKDSFCKSLLQSDLAKTRKGLESQIVFVLRQRSIRSCSASVRLNRGSFLAN